MHWLNGFKDLRLDIVGLIAVLGEGSVTRNAQVASLSWWSVLPRLLPAPQALLEQERKKRLPTSPGIVVGAYSGQVRKEINFFGDLLHGDPLSDYEVQLVEVHRKEDIDGKIRTRPFDPKQYGSLWMLSITGFAMSIALIVWACVNNDGFGLLSVVMLSAVSSFTGLGTHWSLAFKEPGNPQTRDRQKVLPKAELVIYYPNGSMRVIRTEERIMQLYFLAEHCEYLINDTLYRALALFATLMLICGVVSLANASPLVQVAFALAYVLLNALYWAASALNPRHFHWACAYQVIITPFRLEGIPDAIQRMDTADSTTYRLKKRFKERLEAFQRRIVVWYTGHPPLPILHPKARNFTAALWQAIFLTRTSGWLNEATHIAPINDAWKQWLMEAEAAAPNSLEEYFSQPRRADRLKTDLKRGSVSTQTDPMILKTDWQFQLRLTEIFRQQGQLKEAKRKTQLDAARANRISQTTGPGNAVDDV